MNSNSDCQVNLSSSNVTMGTWKSFVIQEYHHVQEISNLIKVVGLILKPIWYKMWDQMLCYIFLLLCLFDLGIEFLLVVGVWKMGLRHGYGWIRGFGCVWVCWCLYFDLGFRLYFDRFVVCILMVLLNLICISFLGVSSSCLWIVRN